MIDAYLDESGIHAEAEVCVIAGYFGGPGQFKKFDRAWRRGLKAIGIEMEEFHAKDFTRSRDPRRVEALAHLVSQFKISPIGYGIVVKDFYLFSETQRKFLTGATLEETGRVKQAGSPDKPYFLPFQHIVRRLASYAPVGGKVNFPFGLDRTFAGIARATFEPCPTIFPSSFAVSRTTHAGKASSARCSINCAVVLHRLWQVEHRENGHLRATGFKFPQQTSPSRRVSPSELRPSTHDLIRHPIFFSPDRKRSNWYVRTVVGIWAAIVICSRHQERVLSFSTPATEPFGILFLRASEKAARVINREG